MTTAKERVEIELKELEERLGKLKTFVLSEPFFEIVDCAADVAYVANRHHDVVCELLTSST